MPTTLPESSPESTGTSASVAPATQPPTPTISASSGVQPTSAQVDEALVEKLLSHPRLQAAIDERAERKAQSVKDKRLQSQDQRIAEIERLAQYLPGVKPEDVRTARREMLLDDLEAGRYSPATDPGRSEAVEANRLWEGAKKIFSKAGIPENDPEVIALASKSYNSEADYFADVAGIAAQRVRPPVPAAAIVTDGGGGITSIPADKETRMAQINERMAGLQKSPVTNQVEIKKLTDELSGLVKAH